MRKRIFFILIITLFISVFVYSQSITVTSPHSGDFWEKGKTYTITWTKSGTMNANVKIRLMQNGSRVLPITDSTPNNGSYSWEVPVDLANGSYYIRVKTVDNQVYDDGEAFTIGNSSSASITVTNPHSGQIWCKGKTYTITWTKSGTMYPNVKIRLFHGSTKIPITDSTPNNGSYSWEVPVDLANGSYYIRVKTVDNQVYDDGEAFTIQNCFVGIGNNTNYSKYGSAYKLQKLPDLTPEKENVGFINWELKIVRFRVDIRNKGASDAHNIPVKLEVYKRGAPARLLKTFTDSIDFLPQEVYVTRVFDYKLPEIGTYDFIFKINPDHTVSEYRYDNNTSVRKSISREKLPDLIVWLMTKRVDIISRSKIWIGVQNIGQKTSPPTKLKVYIQTKGTKYLDIPAIEPGKFYTAERKEWFHSLKDVWVEMWIDPFNTIREDREKNNHAKTKLDVWSHTVFSK